MAEFGRRDVWKQAWPIIISQASVPLVGLVDTAVIGRTAGAAELAAVALGVAVINFIFWTFGFLRMGTTGLTARAVGEDDHEEAQAILLRSLGTSLGLGALLVLLQGPLTYGALWLLGGSTEAEALAREYAAARFFGAPAALATYVLNGWLLGLHRSRHALALQLVMNVVNIAASVSFVALLGWGVAGVGYGTMVAEYAALLSGVLLCVHVIKRTGGWRASAASKERLFDPHKIKRMFQVNGDIMVRTIALLSMFTWFTDSGARQGDVALAANHILMQLLSVVAFVLDAFAFTAEARVGEAMGARSKAKFWRAVRFTGEFALAASVVFAIALALGGDIFVALLTRDEVVREVASNFVPFVALIAVLGALPWMLDGIFVGATRSARMRDGAVIALVAYIALDVALRPYGNLGVWIAITASYIFRAAALGIFVPGLLKSIDEGEEKS